MDTEQSEAPDIDLGPWTERTLALSTAHWPGLGTCEALQTTLGPAYKPHDYGGRVLVGAFDGTEKCLDKLPGPVAAIIKEAHAQGFRWVDFDADADVCPAFPTFDW